MRFFSLRSLLGAGLAGACALIASHADAFALKVLPIPITLTNGATSTMVELANEGSQPVRVQASAFDWTQSASGEDRLSPSNEIVLFPSMLTIAPGATRKLRVGSQGGYGPSEKTFRVMFAEVPPDSSPVDGQEVVRVISKVSVPIFLTPPGAVGVPKVEGLSVTKSAVRFGVHNTGAAHALVEKVHVEFRGEGGKPLSTTDAAGWYVLPGLTRPFEIELGKSLSCANAKTLVVTVTSRESGASSATLDRPPCAG
jgi:fimbrial chaperone protein